MASAASLVASRVDTHVDSLPLVRAWKNQGSKGKAFTDVVHAIYETSLQFNIALSLVYVPSKGNLADAPLQGSLFQRLHGPLVFGWTLRNAGALTPSI